MGLKETIKSGVDTAFKAMGNLKLQGTFYSSDSSYNPSSGLVSESDVSYSVETIRSEFSKFEDSRDDNSPRIGDFKLLVIADDIPTPKLIDKVVIDGVTYNIFGFTIDPADALYEFHTRAIQ